MAGLYASPRCVTVLRLTNIPEPPEWGKRSVCLFGLKNGIEEQAILATLGSFGQIETCELHTAPAIVRFATREAAVAAVAAGAEQLCKGIGMLYNTQPYERRGWCHAESNFAKIILGTHSELGLGSAGHAPKMIDVLDEQPVTLTSAPTTDAFKAQFEETEGRSEKQVIAFTGKGDEEKVVDMYASFYTSVVFEERARQRMREQRAAADRRKRRIRLVAFGGGLVALLASLAGIVVGLLQSSPMISATILSIMGIAFFWGVFSMLLAVLPTDEDLLRGLSVNLALPLLGWFFWWLAGRPLHPLTTANLWSFSAAFSLLAMCDCLAAAAFLPAWRDAFLAGLLPCRSTRVGPRAMTAPACLSRIWLVSRLLAGVAGVLVVSMAAVDSNLWPFYLAGAAILLTAVALRPSARRYLQARLARLGASGGSDDAQLAALAALSGGGEKALARAQAAFRLLPFDTLTAESSVFVSHSWHDSREGKFAALQRWAEGDTAERGTAPLLWLDAACVTPEDAGALELLPLLVSGCQRFLILAGPTYANRRARRRPRERNGGDIDRVTVLPVVEASNEADEAAADATKALQRELGRFSVERARCSQERDTQKLLGCIEAGFGKYESFNQVVRRIFSGRSSSSFGVAAPSRMPFELEPSAMDEQLRHAAHVIQRHARRFIA
ncbi:hypothetical protein EMIHUDRAFT_235468 [Emiliania huxleyi CCMP1516]|uniref:RRM domain-containing protein n=2 Tax=Emiliania huxleyi TaxID=2903 RepID=A0A0D3JVS8_EMIH1|nr:hypothetical protein EMIHUDRAFT_235468 [Emiliania huxleyi CCMP1516]EOD27613.1 hypothetical protein EMIHUDRAFT_235468 [Emiliania huxleyi CCMP1516]|eukprot:XP_005780042.1 hypothetical protein EMIHUDRAFT_235468 [Emiliania huxleyi CCMP1516]